MTEVSFHLHVPGRLRHVCRLARKALHAQARMVVLAAPELQQQLSPMLWGFAPTDFLAHACDGADENMLALSPIVLLSSLEAGAQQRDMLVNLSEDMPPDIGRFARVIEVVAAQDEAGLQRARQRWKRYVASGCKVQYHNLGA